MDFTLTDEQELLRSTARALLTKESPSSLVRAYRDDTAVIEPLWRDHLCEWVALGDGSLVDHCLFLEEAGAVVLPGPYLAASALFLPLLRAVDHPDADAVAAGEVSGTVAWAGASGLWLPDPPPEPRRTFVPDLHHVDQLAVVLPGPAVVVVPASAVERQPMETLDWTRRVFAIDSSAELGEARPVGPDVLARLLARASVAAAAELVGVSRWLLDTTVAYSRERVQFDRPIGSFQALQFKMVDTALDHERATASVYYAAMALDADDPEASRAAHVAKAAAGNAARHAAKEAVQIHGGIGYTWESDVHIYLRRAYAGEAFLNPSAWHHERLADALFA